MPFKSILHINSNASVLGSVCDTFNHTHPKSTLSPKPDGLTLSMVEQAIEKDTLKHPSSYPTLEKLLANTFSSVDALNASFSLGLTQLSYSHPNLDFQDLATFYTLISSLPTPQPSQLVLSTVLLLLRRPMCLISSPSHILFLLIILENPLLRSTSSFALSPLSPTSLPLEVLERTVAILANSPKRARHYLLNWVSRYPQSHIQQNVELINALITRRLNSYHQPRLQNKYKRVLSLFSLTAFSPSPNSKSSLLQVVPYSAMTPQPPTPQERSASDPTALPTAAAAKNPKSNKITVDNYGQDWRIAAFARLQAIFFNANMVSGKVPITLFYNTMVDYIDVKADFVAWERMGVPKSTIQGISFFSSVHAAGPSFPANLDYLEAGLLEQNSSFAICQYPFLLSMGGKTQILEYDARRFMEYKAQEAFINSLDSGVPLRPYLHIRVRRDNLLQDSFDFFEAHENELKKAIRVEFIGEPGIDVGGPRKEWFLLLMRELFDPLRGMFTEDDDSKFCWFNANSCQPEKLYKLTGVALGLALYNSTILDSSFAPVLFNRLLGYSYTLKDFSKLWPVFGSSLQYLLDYEGEDFEEIFSLSFTVTQMVNGRPSEVPLLPGGQNIPVTQDNRKEYVKKVMKFHLETSVERQYQPLKQGFFKVVGSNALTLFQPSEIELLIRGSDEPLDIKALRAVTMYKNWVPYHQDANNALVIRWFWRYLESLDSSDQRKLLMFTTGSDRIPATGISTMSLTITRLGGDSNRFPVSHTCFNELCLYEYKSRSKLIEKLSRAVNESEGFGLK